MSTILDPVTIFEVLFEILGDQSEIVRTVDIYESDGATLWREGVGTVDGSVSADIASDVRRTLDLTIYDDDADLDVGSSGGLWYDKIVKVNYGYRLSDGRLWATCLGTFMIDKIAADHFPENVIKVSGRDLAKKLIQSKFGRATTFKAGQKVDDVVKAIALNGGITKFLLSGSNKTLGKDFTFEADVPRWTAIKDLAVAYGMEVFFDANGYMVMRVPLDPSTSPANWTFQTGTFGSIATYSKSINDTRLYNHIVVTGESANTVPVVAEARNTTPGSPTSVDAIGERTYRYTSAFITSEEQAQDVADNFLKVKSLEEFEASLSTIVVPILDVGMIVDFIDPNPFQGQPTRYLYASNSIPLALGTMSSSLKRVEIV